MTLDPRQIRAFLAVVETGSLGRAADVLHVTQPGLSRTIKRLETQLKAQLFERQAGGMELTSFGQALLPYANLLEAESAHALEEFDALRGLERGVLRIGSVASATVSVLPGVLARMTAGFSKVQVQITEAVEDKLAQALSANAIDVAFASSIVETEDIAKVAEHAFHDRYAVIAAADHDLCKHSALTMRELEGCSWVMPPEGAEPRTQFNAQVQRLGFGPPPVLVETRSLCAIKAMVTQTRFLGWLPEPLFAAERAAGQICTLPVEGMAMERRFFVYRRRRSFTSPLLQYFLDEIRRN